MKFCKACPSQHQCAEEGECIGADNFRELITVYLREVDAGTDNACWVVCAKGDPGACAFNQV